MKERKDFPSFSIIPIEEGIVHIHMKELEELTVDDVAQVHAALEKINNGKRTGVLTTFDGFIPSPGKEVAQYSSSAKAQKLIFATAYLIDSLAMRLVVRFFLNFYKHKIIRKIFSNEQQALEWLREMRDKEK